MHRVQLYFEQLEQRAVPAVYPLTPAAVRHAYGFDQVVGDGKGQTIAIIDAYDAPNIFKDADTFDKSFTWSGSGQTIYSQFGASTSWLTKVNPTGHIPRANVGWAQEISLDVEWAHAIAPAAKIMLVEASSNSLTSLLSAVDYATTHGAQVVSMSWGSGEFSGEAAYDSHFLHTGVTYVASSGDAGSVTEWPAVSPNVIGVGGTSLNVDASGNYISESAWTDSGGGVSAYESKPSYQSGVTLSATKRTSPDLGYDADPNTGFWVYDSYHAGGWGEYGGTSAGAPQVAAMIALANQGRTSALSSSGALTAIYSLNAAADFHDVSSGNAGANSATTGYDMVSGVGSPKASLLIGLLQSGSVSSSLVKNAASTNTTSTTDTHSTAVRGGTGSVESHFFFVADLATQNVVLAPAPAVQLAGQPLDVQVFMMPSMQPSPTSRAAFQQLGQNLDLPEDDDSPAPPAANRPPAAAPAAPQPVQDAGYWLPALDLIFSQEMPPREQIWDAPAAPVEPAMDDSCMVAAMALVGGAVLAGTRNGSPQDRWTDDKRRQRAKR